MVAPVEISVVVPVYRSEGMLPELVERLCTTINSLGRKYELILVDDGSPDGSWSVLERLQRRYPDRVIVIQLMRNFGQQNALMCGFRQCRGRYVVTLDDDLQNPPEEIPKLIDALETRQADVAYGRYSAKQHSVWRNIASRLSHWFFERVCGVQAYASSFRAVRRELVEAICAYNLNFTMVDGLLAWHTQRIVDVEVAHHPRGSGRSGYSIGRLLLHAINLFTNFSLVPLQLVTLAGFAASMAGLATAFYFLMQHFFGLIAVPGFASTLIAILVLGGVQLMAIGILGEYLGRVHLNVNRKPQYTIRQTRARVDPVDEVRPSAAGGDVPMARTASGAGATKG